MVKKDWFYENWGKTRRRFAWFPIQIGQYNIWWEYYDETLTGRVREGFNQWKLEHPSTCGSDKFIQLGRSYSGGFALPMNGMEIIYVKEVLDKVFIGVDK